MPRDLTPAMEAEIQKKNVRPVILLEAEFVSGTIYVTNLSWPIVWNGQTWTGLGRLGSISAIPEETEIRAAGIQISLSGIPKDLMKKALAECRQGKPCKVWFGTLDAQHRLIADPGKMFQGRIDVPRVMVGRDTSTITITVENQLIDLFRPRLLRYTHEDQQILFPGMNDKGFEFVTSIQEWQGSAGGAGASVPRLPGETIWQMVRRVGGGG